MQNSITEIVAAICTALTAIGGLIQVIITVRTKNAIADRDNATKNQLALIAAQTAAAKERADFAALAVVASKEERREQLERVERKIDASAEASRAAEAVANGHNAKIVELREDFNKFAQTKPEA